jgi:hypothetical protein
MIPSHYIENGPIAKNGKKVRAVKMNTMMDNTPIKRKPEVFIGSTTSFLSLRVNDPAIANINTIGINRPSNMTHAVDQFQNGVFADVPR